MQAISSDLSSILQLNQFALQITAPPSPTPVAGNMSQELLNEMAVSTPEISNSSMPFDMAMNDIASYKDVISAAQDGISQMRTQGQSIKDIVAQAQQGGLSQELIDKMQAEVDEKILDISIIKDAAESNNNNPYMNQNTLTVNDIQNLMGVSGNDGVMSALTNGLNSYDFDISFNLDGISFEGSAKIAMGMAADGSFQFAFDVSLDYDLSGLTSEGGGITSPDASGIIDNFMNMLDNQDSILNKANKIVDSAFQKIFDSMNSTLSGGNQNQNYMDSSSFLSQQIMQQSSATMNSIMLNQMPNIALSLI